MVISHRRLNRKIGKRKGFGVLDDHGLDEKIGKKKEKNDLDLDEDDEDDEILHGHNHNLNLLFCFLSSDS